MFLISVKAIFFYQNGPYAYYTSDFATDTEGDGYAVEKPIMFIMSILCNIFSNFQGAVYSARLKCESGMFIAYKNLHVKYYFCLFLPQSS